jgi:hypothetical protein
MHVNQRLLGRSLGAARRRGKPNADSRSHSCERKQRYTPTKGIDHRGESPFRPDAFNADLYEAFASAIGCGAPPARAAAPAHIQAAQQ